jgi:hypothetical protein
MAYIIGASPGSVYSQTDMVRGKCPVPGTRHQDSVAGKEYVLVEVVTGNLTTGMVVTLDADWKATQLPALPGAPLSAGQVAVLIATITASASALVWAQVWGRCNIMASLSCLPTTLVSAGAVAGRVDSDVTSSLSAVIDGIHLTTTASVSGLNPAVLNYPRFRGGQT